MENKNFVYKGWRTSGFLMLAVDLLLLAGSVTGIVFGAMRLDDALPGGGWLLSAGIVGVLVSLLTFFLYKRVEKLFFRKKHTA